MCLKWAFVDLSFSDHFHVFYFLHITSLCRVFLLFSIWPYLRVRKIKWLAFSNSTVLRLLHFNQQIFVECPLCLLLFQQMRQKRNLPSRCSFLLIVATLALSIRMCFCLENSNTMVPFFYLSQSQTNLSWSMVLSLHA